MHVARSGNSSEDELPVPGDYRIGCPEGGIKPEVSWSSDKREGCVSGLVELFWKGFMFGINSSGYYNSTRKIIGQTVRRGGGSMFGMLEEGGRPTDSVLLFYVFF